MGNSRKYPCHTMDGFHILSPPPPLPPPPVVFGISKMRFPFMPLEFQNCQLPFRSNFPFFLQIVLNNQQGSQTCLVWL